MKIACLTEYMTEVACVLGDRLWHPENGQAKVIQGMAGLRSAPSRERRSHEH